MNVYIIIGLFIAAIIVIVLTCNPRHEGLGFPFNTLTKQPETIVQDKLYLQPYCTDVLGDPIPCAKPCQDYCPSCLYNFPVPVFGPDAGAYSPNKWCPGPPVC